MDREFAEVDPESDPYSKAFELSKILDKIEDETSPDTLTWAKTIQPLAHLSLETGYHDGMQQVERSLAEHVWGDDRSISPFRFKTLRSLGQYEMLQGNALAAQSYFKRSAEHAPTLAWEVCAHLDRATVADIRKQPDWAEEELSEADRLATEVDWSGCEDDERIALLNLGLLFVNRDIAKSDRYVGMFTSRPARRSNLNDRRLLAMGHAARANVEHAKGNFGEAETLYRIAYSMFDAIGFGWRAAMQAIGLVMTTGQETWVELAKIKIAPYPKSYIADIIRSITTEIDPSLLRLSTGEKELLRAVYEHPSETTQAISNRLFKSRSRVNNMLTKLYREYNVKSKPALLEAVRKRQTFM